MKTNVMAPSSERAQGYTYGTAQVARSPFSEREFDLLKQTVLFTEDDVRHLQMAGKALDDQIEAVLDVWYEFVGSHPHLLHYFSGPDGQPISDYLTAVRRRFGQWIRDTCAARYDRSWLDYQQEIALRHTRAKKDQTDHVHSAADQIPLRYLIAFIYPITATIRPFLEKKEQNAEKVEKMHQAWSKSVVLQIALWSEAYLRDGATSIQ